MGIDPQIIELKKVIESAHINFLFGSGASRPFLETLNNLEANITYLNDSVEEDIKGNIDLLKASVFIEYLNKCLFGNLFFDSEDHSGYIKTCKVSGQEKDDEFKEVKNFYELFISNISQLLGNRDIQLLSKQINIFTTNVDVFFEEALEVNNCSFNDGFGGRRELVFDTVNFHNTVHKLSTHYEYKSEVPHVNLFKIHGSLNWLKSKEKSYSEYNITADYSLDNLRKIYEMVQKERANFIDYSLINGGVVSGNFTFLEEHKYNKEIVRDFLLLYNQIVMVNPTKQKFEDTTRNVHYYEMLRMYANHLERENSVLFVLGFSFADEHIQKITQRVAKSNPTLIIYLLCAESQRIGFENIFKSFSNVKCIYPQEGYFTLEKLNLYLSQIIESIPTNK
ncbi:hypothetical protein D3C87_356650 [compost metagenome]